MELIPVGDTFALRFTEAEKARISMAQEMYEASPDWQRQYEEFMASLPDGSLTVDFSQEA